MLWILLIFGGFRAIILFLFAIIALFEQEWCDVREYGIKMVICIIVGSVGFFGLYGINAISYDEILQTDDWELIPITDNNQISAKGSDELFYVHVSIDTNNVYSFHYRVNDDEFNNKGVMTIYEKDDCTPHVVEYTTHTKNKMNSILRIILAFGYGESSQKTYEIYTPTKTILWTFN